MKRLVVAVLAVSSLVAHADPPRVEFDVAVTAGTDAAMDHQAIVVGAEAPLSETWRFHGQLARGRADSAAALAPNVFMSLRAGFERQHRRQPHRRFAIRPAAQLFVGPAHSPGSGVASLRSPVMR
ncbi:MAG: hypothetical protein E6J90_31395 [Deltaproteobacteria bacterium]|nr:MAG: hypothetical protein E6J91_25335 [Deltaproteobacteria bacterium]TMQ12441.1 MAG: hypothetical protein E6J90_31395 [Deltaproteobacteria bacterium]